MDWNGEVAHPYRTFILAIHASDWHRAGEYGFGLLRTFLDHLTTHIGDIKPMFDDRDVWPSLAPIRRCGGPICRVESGKSWEMPGHATLNAVLSTRTMMDQVRAGEPYPSVLEVESRQ